jgi:hypothetical protein
MWMILPPSIFLFNKEKGRLFPFWISFFVSLLFCCFPCVEPLETMVQSINPSNEKKNKRPSAMCDVLKDGISKRKAQTQ